MDKFARKLFYGPEQKMILQECNIPPEAFNQTVQRMQIAHNIPGIFVAESLFERRHSRESMHDGPYDLLVAGGGSFLWSDLNSERVQQVRAGEVIAQFWSGRGPVKVPGGLIHDSIAAAFIPESTIQEIFAVIRDYDNHKNIYKPEVLDSKLISRGMTISKSICGF